LLRSYVLITVCKRPKTLISDHYDLIDRGEGGKEEKISKFGGDVDSNYSGIARKRISMSEKTPVEALSSYQTPELSFLLFGLFQIRALL
jgi:hypothetical protein